MINAEYFIAHNRREVAELTILRRLAQEASRLDCAALELPCPGDIRKERQAERELVDALGRMQAAMEIAMERFEFGDKAAAAREKVGTKWAREIDPEWRCASDGQA